MTDKNFPLHIAIIESDEDQARKLIVSDINLSELNDDDWSPMHLCGQTNNERIARWLINAGAKINIRNSKGVTPLHSCAWTNAAQVAYLLLGNGANPNLKDDSSWTPLMLASWNNHHKIIELLLKNSASMNARSKTGSTSLHFAAYNNAPLAIDTLLENKASVNVLNNDGLTAYDLAVRKNNQDCSVKLQKMTTAGKQQPNQVSSSLIEVKVEDYFTSEVGLPAGDTIPLVQETTNNKKPTSKKSSTGRRKKATLTKEAVIARPSAITEELVNKDSFFLDTQEVDMPFLTELTKDQAKLSSDGNTSEILFPEQLINITLNGEKVRRKSEVVIANLLFSFDISYVYERKLCGTVAVGINYPAFTMFTKDDRIIIWVHVSGLSTSEKRKQFNQLKRWYKLNGFIEGETFFSTQDSIEGGVDSPTILEAIETIANEIEASEKRAAMAHEEDNM